MASATAPRSASGKDIFVAPPSLVEAVVRELRRRILAGQYRPGERLTEERISRELGVSRPPLREAVRVLQRDGLLTAEPRRGVSVIPLTAKDVREIYSLRHALEDLAAELGVPVRDPERLEPLRDALADMRRAARKKDIAVLSAANLAFHRAFADLPRHERLMRSYDSITAQLQMCMALNLRFRESVFHDPEESVKRHVLLLRLIEAGDRRVLKKAIAVHGDRSFLSTLDEMIDPSAEPSAARAATERRSRASHRLRDRDR